MMMNINIDINGVTIMNAKQAAAVAGGKEKQGKKAKAKAVEESVALPVPHVAVGGAGAAKVDDGEGDIEFDESKMMPGFFEGISSLKKMGHQLFFNSMAGEERERTARINFRGMKKITDFIPESNWYFVRTREEKTKTTDATKADVMIDDRYEIVENVKTHGVKHVFWFTVSSKEAPAGVIKVKSWKEIVENITAISA